MILAPRSWPSRPGLATTTRILRSLSAHRREAVLAARRAAELVSATISADDDASSAITPIITRPAPRKVRFASRSSSGPSRKTSWRTSIASASLPLWSSRLLLAAGGLLGQLAGGVVGERLGLPHPAHVPAVDVASNHLEFAHGGHLPAGATELTRSPRGSWASGPCRRES